MMAKRKPVKTATDHQVAALKLRHDGLTIEKIAEQLGMTPAKVRELTDFSRLSRREICQRLETVLIDVTSGAITIAQANALTRAYGEQIKEFDPRRFGKRALQC